MHWENSASGLKKWNFGIHMISTWKYFYFKIFEVGLTCYQLEIFWDVRSSCRSQEGLKPKTRFFSALGTLQILQHVILKKANGFVYRKYNNIAHLTEAVTITRWRPWAILLLPVLSPTCKQVYCVHWCLLNGLLVFCMAITFQLNCGSC